MNQPSSVRIVSGSKISFSSGMSCIKFFSLIFQGLYPELLSGAFVTGMFIRVTEEDGDEPYPRETVLPKPSAGTILESNSGWNRNGEFFGTSL